MVNRICRLYILNYIITWNFGFVMNKRYVLWGGLLGAMLLVVFVMVQMVDQDAGNESVAVSADNNRGEQGVLAPRENDWMKGNPEADVVIVKYSDFQCPACRFYASMDDRLSQDLGDDILFIYRHFPLRNFQYSGLASRYAEAAGRQGNFWGMHDLIYINQQRWSRSDDAEPIFNEFVEALELDSRQLEQDLEDPELMERIEADYQSGQNAGVRAVPALFINGEAVDNPRSFEDYRSLIDSYL